MTDKKSKNLVVEITIISVLLVTLLGLKQVYPEIKFEGFNLTLGLALTTNVLFDFAIAGGLLYFLLAGLNLGVKSEFLEKLSNLIFVALLGISLVIILVSLTTVGSLNLAMRFEAAWIFVVIFIAVIALSTFILMAVITPIIKEFSNFLADKLKIFDFKKWFPKIDLRFSENWKQHIVSLLIALIVSFGFFYLGTQNDINLAEEEFQKNLQLTEDELNSTLWMTTPVNLNVTHELDDSAGRLNITVQNKHPSKNTGEIQLYRLNVDPNIPFMIFEEGLKPGEQHNFSLTFYVDCKETPLKGDIRSLIKINSSVYAKAYHSTRTDTLAYKITCDSCSPQGIVRSIPKSDDTLFSFALTSKNYSVCVPIYFWENLRLY